MYMYACTCDSCSNKHALACSPTCMHAHTHTHTQMPCTHVQIENLTCFPLNALGTALPALSCVFCHFKAGSYSITYMGQNFFSLQSEPCLLQDSRSRTRGVVSHE